MKNTSQKVVFPLKHLAFPPFSFRGYWKVKVSLTLRFWGFGG